MHVVLSAFEHASILNWVPELRRIGVNVSMVKPGRDGIVPVSAIMAEIRPETVLISIIAVQNEIGTAQRIEELAKLLEGSGILLHTDAAQSVGRIDLRIALAGADLISLSGHKCYGPKGVGALVVRAGCTGFIHPIFFGGNQQHGYRPGTLPVPQIVGFAEAAHLADSRRASALSEIRELENLFLDEVRKWFPEVSPLVLTGERIPGILSIRFPGVDAEQLLSHNPDIAISAGSACHSGVPGASPVLLAMGLPNDAADECVRICISHLTRPYEIKEAARQLGGSAARLATQTYFSSASIA
jgi:cysteine desulfurase